MTSDTEGTSSEGPGRAVGVLSDSRVVGAERVDGAASAVVALVGRQLRLLGREGSLARAGALRTLTRRPPSEGWTTGTRARAW